MLLTVCHFFALLNYLIVAEQNIVFPVESLPAPQPCPDLESVCSDDPLKYPHEEISAIVSKSIELKIIPEATDRFFGSKAAHLDYDLDSSNEGLKATCEHRNEVVSRFVRARNILGKWVYIAQESENRRQYVKIVQCANPSQPCKNDADSPHGEGTTVCRQLYRTQKYLAIDSNGEMVVDTFRIPSACTCNYVGRFGVHLRGSFESQRARKPPKCNADNATQNLEAPSVPVVSNQPLPKRLSLENSPSNRIQPCESGELLCESEDQSYPKQSIEKMLRTHVAFKSPKFFGTVFGDVCELPDSEFSLRGGFSIQESDLCDSAKKYIYPKKAKSSRGIWHYIINTDEYRQGVLIETCLKFIKGGSCLYGGTEGINPSGTVCQQRFSSHFMLALSPNGTVSLEEFSVPSSCACFIQEEDYMIKRR